MNAALSTGEEKQISVVVPADLIHFKLELFLGTRLVCLDINKRHKIFLVADGNRVTVRRPTDIDVLSYDMQMYIYYKQCCERSQVKVISNQNQNHRDKK